MSLSWFDRWDKHVYIKYVWKHVSGPLEELKNVAEKRRPGHLCLDCCPHLD